MKICLVTAFPPSRRGLNEYGFHIARELRRDPLLSLTVLADELDGSPQEFDDFDVSPLLALRFAVAILCVCCKTIQRHQAGCGVVQPAVFDIRQQSGRGIFRAYRCLCCRA